MPKELELEVVCPDCGWVQTYHSYNKPSEISGKRRTDCRKCGRSFKVLDQRKEKVKTHRRMENDSEKPFGWHKYSKDEGKST